MAKYETHLPYLYIVYIKITVKNRDFLERKIPAYWTRNDHLNS